MGDSWEMFDNFGNVKDILGIWRYLGDIIFGGCFWLWIYFEDRNWRIV